MRRGVPRRKPSESLRKYHFDQRFFRSIDTLPKAYWLGFLVADGYVAERRANKIISLTLAQKDECHIEKFQKAIGHYGPSLPIKREHPATRLVLRSSDMFWDLRELGLSNCKSFHCYVPDIDAELYSHFYRGLIDGDGCWTYHRQRKCWNLKLCGTREVCDSFRQWVASLVKTKASVHKHKSIYEIKFAGNNLVRKIAEILYENAYKEIWLDRKYNKAIAIVQGFIDEATAT